MANLTTKSKLNLINYFKEEGNNYFKQKEYTQSLEYYQNCLLFLDAIYFDQNNDEKQDNNIQTLTSTILSNISQTHLHLHTENPDLYNHLLSALNCAQISLHLNANNLKSITRRIISLYRLGMHPFAEQLIKNTNPKDIAPSMTLIEKERDSNVNQSVKYHVDRFKHALLKNNSTSFGDIDCEKNVFLRIAAAELIREERYTLEYFIDRFFDRKVESLQVIGMMAVFMNWNYEKIATVFVKYLKKLSIKSSFNKTKKIIVQTLKMDNLIWPTGQAWKEIAGLIILDRHEIEYCDILNCRDIGQLNGVYDKYKHQLMKVTGIEFEKMVDNRESVKDVNYKWIQSEMNEIKRWHDIDKENIMKLTKALKQVQEKYEKLKKKMIVVEAVNGKMRKDFEILQVKMYNMQIVFAVIVVLVAAMVLACK